LAGMWVEVLALARRDVGLGGASSWFRVAGREGRGGWRGVAWLWERESQ
jgi:hypothetical protein